MSRVTTPTTPPTHIGSPTTAAASLLRPSTEDDVEAIAALWHRGWLDAHLGHVPDALLAHRHPDDFRALVPARLDTTTVATIDDRVVGFVVTHDDEIEQVYVDAAARGTGVAVELLARGEAVIGRRFPTAWLAVVAGNARARRFYERNGWFDAGPFEYSARTPSGGTVPVPVHRYEKHLERPAP